MFDVGFSELVVIFGVSLVVLGPKRLPGLVNKVGRWVGKARVMANDFRRQLETEVNLEELNKMTDLQSQQNHNAYPTPPPGLNGEPAPESTTYPYAVDSAATAADAPVDVATTDDTYSHAHADGDAPMPWTPEPVVEPATVEPATVEPASAEPPLESSVTGTPRQADLDLSVPDDTQRHS
jgi:sec-independent protein translocase protein TatB